MRVNKAAFLYFVWFFRFFRDFNGVDAFADMNFMAFSVPSQELRCQIFAMLKNSRWFWRKTLFSKKTSWFGEFWEYAWSGTEKFFHEQDNTFLLSSFLSLDEGSLLADGNMRPSTEYRTCQKKSLYISASSIIQVLRLVSSLESADSNEFASLKTSETGSVWFEII